MQRFEKKDIRFESADGRSTVAGWSYQHPTVQPFCVLQISHGMCEHMGRYEDFIGFLCENGVAVFGNDHLGHGATSAPENWGHFGEKNGRRFALEDLMTMNGMAHRAFPGLPVVLLGHSMGSFFVRRYAVLYPQTIQGLILSGTGGPRPSPAAGIWLAALMMRLGRGRHRSKLVHNLAFGQYLKRVEAPRTPYDWISRDETVVDAYAADERNTFRFTVNGFHELFSALWEVSSPQWAAAIPKGLPVMLFAGDADPVGNYGEGPKTVYRWLRAAGVKDLELKMYPGGRHEMLNETNRREVYADVLAFLRARWGGNAPAKPPA